MRHLGEAVLVGLGATGPFRRKRGGGRLILAYHNIVPDDLPQGGEPSLHLPLALFRQQLDLLERRFDVVPLDQLSVSGGGRPRVAITFDDAYLGALALGIPELKRRGFPATVFVPPGLLGGQVLWWDEAWSAASSRSLSDRLRHRALVEWRGDGRLVRQQLASMGWLLDPDRVPPLARTAALEDLAAAVGTPGLTVGAHSWSHPNLTVVSPDGLRAELEEPLTWLRTRWPRHTVPWIAYPYGLSDHRVMAAARDAGYTGGLRVSGGWLGAGKPPALKHPRLNVPAGVTLRGFDLRLAGWLAR